MIKREFDLTLVEREQTEELLDELQQRIADMKKRKNTELKTTNLVSRYEPITHTIKLGDDRVVVKERASEVRVSHGPNEVVAITGLNLDMIDIEGLDKALQIMRRYMILEDLACIEPDED